MLLQLLKRHTITKEYALHSFQFSPLKNKRIYIIVIVSSRDSISKKYIKHDKHFFWKGQQLKKCTHCAYVKRSNHNNYSYKPLSLSSFVSNLSLLIIPFFNPFIKSTQLSSLVQRKRKCFLDFMFLINKSLITKPN